MREFLAIALCATFVACDAAGRGSVQSSSVDGSDIREVREAPTRVEVGGLPVTLTSSLWVDVSPSVPPRTSPPSIQGIATMIASDGHLAGRIARVDHVWLVSDNRVWDQPRPEEQDIEDPSFADATGNPRNRPKADAFRIVIRSGPAWDPDSPVDVVVRFVDASGQEGLLRAPSQAVGRVQ